jgi:hypothetical protein
VKRAWPLVCLLVVLVSWPSLARAEDAPRPWWQTFYARVGQRDLVGVNAWSARTIGLGWRLERRGWGVDVSVANLQYGGTHDEGLDTAATVLAYVDGARWLGPHVWLGGGLSYGWSRGYVDAFLPRRTGHGFQAEAVLGYELPRAAYVPLFVQASLTVPLYQLYDRYRSTGSDVYALGVEAAMGVRF